MIHTDLIELLDDLAHHVDGMRRYAATIVPESTAAVALRAQADLIEAHFLTDDVTGEVFPNWSVETGRAWGAKVWKRQEDERAKAGGLR